MSKHAHTHSHDATHAHEHSGPNRDWLFATGSLLLLLAGLWMDIWLKPSWFNGPVRILWYGIAYTPVGLPVLMKGLKLAFKGQLFTEFILMSIATIGAFYIGEYPEGVAVMLFYAIGELFQDAAVHRAKRSIKALLDVRPDVAMVSRNGNYVNVDPTDVKVNETIRVRVGDRVPLDGEIINEASSFNTSALTGESRPRSIGIGETALAGMINEERVVDLKVTRLFNESSLARILTLVQNATGRKAKTELFIRRFAAVYTPVVVFLALGLTFIPYFFVDTYVFDQWLYRALIFLVISCPCALVVAIPLGYFGGIGAGSRNGILFKGSSFLDRMTRVKTVVMDKTGTLTKGVFKVQEVVSKELPEKEWLPILAAIESRSTHPVAKAIVEYTQLGTQNFSITSLEEIKGHGLRAQVDGREVIAGNVKLLDRFGVRVDDTTRALADTITAVAIDKKFAGYVIISDEVKTDAKEAITQMHDAGINTIMLSGDKQAVVDRVAKSVGIDQAFGDLLPEDKVARFEQIKKGKKEAVAFVGDGINDAPVLALSNVGIAMGGMGSDAAIETADVVIQTDQPTKIMTAVKIGKATNNIVWQNIGLAFGVKLIVLALGAGGVATMWEAVFADVGVALLAILNAVRIQRMRF